MSVTEPSKNAPVQGRIVIASAVAALAFEAAKWLGSYPMTIPLKLLAIAPLIWMAWTGRNGVLAMYFITTGLAFHAAGDGLLEVSTVHAQPWFLLAVGMFLLGHISYAIAFSKIHRGGKVIEHPIVLAMMLVVTLCASAAIVRALVENPALAPMRLPIGIYMVAITIMGCLACIKSRSTLVAAGALLYVVSDTIHGIDKFVQPLTEFGINVGLVTFPIYYVCQVMIVLGMLANLSSGALRNGYGNAEMEWQAGSR